MQKDNDDKGYECSTAICAAGADSITAVQCYCYTWKTTVSSSDVVEVLYAGMQGSSSASYTAPRLTYPQDTHDAAGGLHAEESESDILPFAIDGDTAAFDATSPAADGKPGIPGVVWP